VLNSCPQTKVYWAYSQGRLGFSFFLYRSKDLMRGNYMAMIEAGVTGFPFDQFSSWGFGGLGVPDDSPELREQNHQWWVELQPVFEAEILRRASNDEFSTGKWAVPVGEEEWHPTNKTTEEQVESTARDHPDVKRLLGLGADIGYLQFFPDYSAWLAAVTGASGEEGMLWEIWIDDAPAGEVLINGIQIVEDMRQAGYPIPPDEELVRL
jgi:hypothetical protein